MHIHITGASHEFEPDVAAVAERKIATLSKYLGEKDETTRTFVELGKETGEHHRAGKIWRAEINLDTVGKAYRAVALEESIENALDEVIAEVAQELRKAKRRDHSLIKRGGTAIKSILRGFRG